MKTNTTTNEESTNKNRPLVLSLGSCFGILNSANKRREEGESKETERAPHSSLLLLRAKSHRGGSRLSQHAPQVVAPDMHADLASKMASTWVLPELSQSY